MDIKTVKVRDVYKLIGIDYPSCYTSLNKQLGSEGNPFAKVKLGSSFVWTDVRGDWQSLDQASPAKAEQVRGALENVRERVAAKLPSEMVDILFTVPDSSYVFYRDEPDGIRLLITGWGLKYPKKIEGTHEIRKVPVHHPVSVSFSYAGERLKNFDFALRLSKQLKRLSTDSQGIYSFDRLEVSKPYQLIDVDSGRTFDLVVESGRNHYDFDLTHYTKVTVHVECNATAQSRETVLIECGNQSESAMTDADGQVEMMMVYREGTDISVKVRDQRQSKPSTHDDVAFSFSFESTVAEEPVPEPNPVPNPDSVPNPDPVPESKPVPEPKPVLVRVKVVVRKNGACLYGENIHLEYAGIMRDGLTSSQGAWTCELEWAEGAPCRVRVDGYDLQEQLLEANQEHLFEFDAEDIPEPRMMLLTVLDEKGQPLKGVQVMLQQGEHQPVSVLLDENGKAQMDKSLFITGEEVRADLRGGALHYSDILFTIDEDEDEYLLQEHHEHQRFGWATILMEVLVVTVVAVASHVMVFPAFVALSQYLNGLIYS